jgi:hypothetical protein
MSRRPVFASALNVVAATLRAKTRGMTGPEALALLAAEQTRLPECHPLHTALSRFAREVGMAHGNTPRIRAAADALHHAARLAMQPDQPQRADIHG